MGQGQKGVLEISVLPYKGLGLKRAPSFLIRLQWSSKVFSAPVNPTCRFM